MVGWFEMKTMKTNTIRNMSYVAVGLQGFTLLAVIAITISQKTVQTLMMSSNLLQDITVIPYSTLIVETIILALYIGLMMMSRKESLQNPILVGGLFVAGACIVRIVATYGNMFVNVMYARLKGAEYLAAYSALSSAISMVTSPFNLLAFAVFCMTAGMLMMQRNVNY